MEVNGLTEFQRDLLKIAQRELPRESKKIMQKIGSKARTHVARIARSKVEKLTGNYIGEGKSKYGFRRGKVFKGYNGEIVVRVYNSSPHAHLIEYGHRQVTKDGRETGFVSGKYVLDGAIRDFENSGQTEKMLSEWLDGLLESGKL